MAGYSATSGRSPRPLWFNGTATIAAGHPRLGLELGCNGRPLHGPPSRYGPRDQLTKCTSSEYGDNANCLMGDGCNHFNGYSKAYLSWFEECNGVVGEFIAGRLHAAAGGDRPATAPRCCSCPCRGLRVDQGSQTCRTTPSSCARPSGSTAASRSGPR